MRVLLVATNPQNQLGLRERASGRDGLWAAGGCVSSGTLRPTLMGRAGRPEHVLGVLRTH